MKIISYDRRNKTVAGSPEAIESIYLDPVEKGKGWVFISRGGDETRLEMVDPKMKRMPKTRNVGGVVKGQVYVEGKQWMGEVAECQDGGSFIIARLPEAKPPFQLPGRPNCDEYVRAGFVFGCPFAVWAFMLGIEDLKLARQIMETCNFPAPRALGKLRDAGVTWKDEPCRKFEMPAGFVPFVTPFPVPVAGDHYKVKSEKQIHWRKNGFHWDMTWKEWRAKLGWEGHAGTCATWFLHRFFEHPRPGFYVGPDEWEALEV